MRRHGRLCASPHTRALGRREKAHSPCKRALHAPEGPAFGRAHNLPRRGSKKAHSKPFARAWRNQDSRLPRFRFPCQNYRAHCDHRGRPNPSPALLIPYTGLGARHHCTRLAGEASPRLRTGLPPLGLGRTTLLSIRDASALIRRPDAQGAL